MTPFANAPWIYPTFHWIFILYIFLLVLAAVVYFRIMNYLQKGQKNVFSFWHEFQKFANARKCNQAELNILHAFYASLKTEDADFLLHPENRGKLKNALYQYYLASPQNSSEKAVDLFDKLFRSSVDFKKEINSLEDIAIGEVCALVADSREEITHVMQKTGKDLLLSTKVISKDILVPGKEVSIYFFRPSIGGYILPGTITKLMEKGVVFKHNGVIERKGEAHLMLITKISLFISPWPLKDEEENSPDIDKNKIHLSEANIDKQLELLKRISKEQAAGKPDKFHIQETPRSFTALSERVSDRGITFEFPEGLWKDTWKIQDLWDVHFTFPDGGPPIDVRGKMFPVKQKGNIYLIRYTDIEESLRKLIYEEIKKRGGTKEILS